MKKIGLLIIVIFSLVVSPVLAANCVEHSFGSSTVKYDDSGISKQDNKQQSDKMSKVAHCCCEHHVVARLPIGGSVFAAPAKKVNFVFSDRVSSPFGEQPPLAPPKHV